MHWRYWKVYLATSWDVSEGEADVPEVLIVLFVPLHVLPLADGLGQVHHGQRDLDLREKCSVFLYFQNGVSFQWLQAGLKSKMSEKTQSLFQTLLKQKERGKNKKTKVQNFPKRQESWNFLFFRTFTLENCRINIERSYTKC